MPAFPTRIARHRPEKGQRSAFPAYGGEHTVRVEPYPSRLGLHVAPKRPCSATEIEGISGATSGHEDDRRSRH